MRSHTGRIAVLAAAVMAFMTAGPAIAGQAQADGKAAANAGTKDTGAWGWQLSWGMETGTYPPDAPGSARTESSRKDAVPTVEIGGVSYRIGLDTP